MIKGAIIGCGKVASRSHLSSYNLFQNVKIIAACDISEKIVGSFCKKNKIAHSYTNLDDLLQKEDLDFIDVCTNPSTHYSICLAAIEKGVNVIVEKPITVNLKETIDLSYKSKKKDVKVCPIHNYRFRNNVVKAANIYRQGKLGTMNKISSTVHSSGPYPDWFWDEEANGGVLYESAIHFIDIQTLFCGEHEKILGVYKKRDQNTNLTTNLSALVLFKSGTLGIIDIAAFAPATYSQVNIFGTASNLYLKFFPDYFSMSLGPISPYAEFKSENKRFFGYTLSLLLKHKNYERAYHSELIQQFIKSIENNTDPPVTIDSVLPTMKLLEALKNY